MSFVTLGDFFRQHLLQTHHVAEAYKRAGDRKNRESTRVVIVNVRDERFLGILVKVIYLRFTGEYLKL